MPDVSSNLRWVCVLYVCADIAKLGKSLESQKKTESNSSSEVEGVMKRVESLEARVRTLAATNADARLSALEGSSKSTQTEVRASLSACRVCMRYVWVDGARDWKEDKEFCSPWSSRPDWSPALGADHEGNRLLWRGMTGDGWVYLKTECNTEGAEAPAAPAATAAPGAPAPAAANATEAPAA